MLHNLIDPAYLLSHYGYIGIFLIVLIESGIFFFLPGDSLLFTAGLLSGSGILNLPVVILLALLGAFFGNLIGYWIGANIEKLHRYALFRRLLHEKHINAAHAFFEKRGKQALVLGRFVPAGRTFIPWVAGIAGMNKKIFIEWSGLGALAWVLIMTLGGFFLGQIFPTLQNYLTEAILIIIFISLLPIGYEWWKGRKVKAAL
ncbi:MAG: DedA family protein [Patescibacteria group bacterium]